MANLGKLWAGRAFGTNTGNLAISFEKDSEELEGLLRFHDEKFGPVVYRVIGTFKEEIRLTGKAETVLEEVEFGDLTVTAKLTSEGSMKGEWATATGTGGPFIAHPHGEKAAENPAEGSSKEPLGIEQFYTQAHILGALNLSKADILSLMEVVKVDFSAGVKLIVTYRSGGAEVTRFSEAFIESMDELDKLVYLKLFIQEPDEFDVNKMVLVELVDRGINRVVVQGVREIWVEGKAQILRNELLRRKRSLVTNFKKFGVSLAQFALFIMIVVMIDIESFWMRMAAGGTFLGAIKIVEWFHAAFIPNASIRLGAGSETWYTRWGASTLSWISGVVAAIISGYIVYHMTLP